MRLKEYTDKISETNTDLKGSKTTQKVQKPILKRFLGKKNGFQISGWSVTLNISFWDLKEYTDKKSESNSGLKVSKTTQKVKKTIFKGFLEKKLGFKNPVGL